jgi:hypothetical protein
MIPIMMSNSIDNGNFFIIGKKCIIYDRYDMEETATEVDPTVDPFLANELRSNRVEKELNAQRQRPVSARERVKNSYQISNLLTRFLRRLMLIMIVGKKI